MDEDDPGELREVPLEPAPDAAVIALLTQDHDEIRQLFQDLAALGGADANVVTKRALMDKLAQTLSQHADTEEEFFYPAAREALDDPDLPRAALADHERMAALLEELRHLSPDDARYDARMSALQGLADRHMDDEENELFPLAGELLADSDELAEQVRARRDELPTTARGADTATSVVDDDQEQSVAGEEDPGAGLDDIEPDAPRA